MGEIRRLEYGEKLIFEIDYSDLKEDAMISLVNDLERLVLIENTPQLILSTFNKKNFLTPKFMRHVEEVTGKNIHLVDKMAFVGLNAIQTFIVRGYNHMFKRNFRAFDSKSEAIDYLLDKSTSDKVVPDFF